MKAIIVLKTVISPEDIDKVPKTNPHSDNDQ